MTALPPPLFHFAHLQQFARLTHFVSGRAGGVSVGAWRGLNLSFGVGDDAGHVHENRRRLAGTLGTTADRLFFARQVHADHVARVDADTTPQALPEADALITGTPGVCLCVTAADCVPVLLYDPVHHAAGAVHAGWRGTVAGVVARAVEAMQRHFGTQPSDLWAGVGPSVGPRVYEVGHEVIAAAARAFGPDAGVIRPASAAGKGFFDLWTANRRQLTTLGVPDGQIETAGLCTFASEESYFSVRRQGAVSGRFAGGVLLLPRG